MDDWRFDPAHDLNLSGPERARSLRREHGLLETIPTLGWRLFLRVYCQLYHRLRVVGRAHLPAQPPFLLVGNHASHLDALVLSSLLPLALADRTFPIAAGDVFFETHASAWFATWVLNALPLWRYNVGEHTMEQLRQRLVGEPCGYILFPEGTRSRDGQIGRFRPGVGMLVAGTPVPVIPCRLVGASRAWPPTGRYPRPFRLTLHVGAPRTFSTTPNDRDGWVAIAQQLEHDVRGLVPEAPRSAVE